MIWVVRMISLAVLLQTIESFWITPWKWSLIRDEIPAPIRPLLQSNRWLLSVRLVAALTALFFVHPLPIAFMLITTWGLAIRWRGTFNGGSDFMTFHILAACLVFSLRPDFEQACVFYVALQIILSFFVAGVAKIKNPAWRNGKALAIFLRRAQIPAVVSWSILIFEILFPLALFLPTPFVVAAILFQIANVYIFGLNRFFFAWLAGYPAVYLASGYLV